jgi:hypothetical protein
VDAAKDVLIRRQDTHLDSLAERLREPRVRRVIEPILAGGALGAVPEDDVRYAQDLGLVRQSSAGGLVIANPIYREVIPSSLATVAIASLPQIQPVWLGADGHIDESRLLDAFIAFWLVIFDRRVGAGRLAERTGAEAATSPGGRRVVVVRA